MADVQRAPSTIEQLVSDVLSHSQLDRRMQASQGDLLREFAGTALMYGPMAIGRSAPMAPVRPPLGPPRPQAIEAPARAPLERAGTSVPSVQDLRGTPPSPWETTSLTPQQMQVMHGYVNRGMERSAAYQLARQFPGD